jgi:hypothetical protein
MDTLSSDPIAYLRSPQAIRDRCGQLFDLACQGKLQHFDCDLTQLQPTAEYVLDVMREHYPDLNVPFHSRWRHFTAGGIDRLTELDQHLANLDRQERARAKFDLAIISVLLDAGAGAAWQFYEAETAQTFHRSEGLAVASFRMFCQGAFSSNSQFPLRVDALRLQEFTIADLHQGFQLREDNPLVGVQGRLDLLQRLGKVLLTDPHRFGTTVPRPGNLVDFLQHQAIANQLAAPTILKAVLDGLGDIWPGRVAIAGKNLGDVWPHSALRNDGPGSQLVPFHKLSQWLTYSLLEPLQELGFEITALEALTGLAEYRNGGLCIDWGLLHPKYPQVLSDRHQPNAEVVVEWRALTVALLDQIADTIRQILNQTPTELPLVKVLEGGTWAAGRKIAAARRPGGIPPLQIDSDGTVF